MKKRLLFTLLLGIYLGAPSLNAQLDLGFRTFTYTTESGLPSNGIKGLQWDEESGFLWIATEAGISRFNGVEFENFTRSNTSFISSERMRFMVRNMAGGIRAADMDGNIFGISTSHPTPLFSRTEQIGIQESRLYGIAVSDSFFKLGFAQPPNRIPFPFAQVIPKSSQITFVVQPGGAVYKIDAQSKRATALSYLGTDNKTGFVIENKLFFSKQKGGLIYRFDELENKLVPIHNPQSNENSKIYWESGMEFPIAISEKKAWEVHFQNNQLVFDLICTDMPDLGLIKYVQFSRKKGLLFLGTASRGFAIVRKNRLKQIKRPDILPTDLSAYYSQWEYTKGAILTNEGHIISRENQKKLPAIRGKFGYSVYREGDSLVWFSQGRPGTQTGSVLHCLDTRKNETGFYDRVPVFNVFGFSRWKKNVLIATHKGLGILDGDSLNFLFKSDPRNTGESVSFNLLEIDPGVYSMASCSGWIRFDLNSMRSDTLLKIPGFCVRAQLKIGDYVFIGTYGKGIYLYHQGKLKSIQLDKNGFLLYAHCFVPDADGSVWISTNRGLFKASAQDMIRSFEKPNTGVYYHYYGRSDGMEMTEMNGGCSPCAITMSDSTLSFPSMDGLLWVHPGTSAPLLPDGPIYIDEIRINDRVVPESDFSQKSISHSENNLSIRLAFSSWCNPENIYLDYQLNDTTAWIPVAKGSAISFNNLSSGKHQLRIRKRNGFGENNFSYKKISFTIELAWYNHPIFYLSGLFLLVLFIQLFSKYQNRKLLKRQKRLEKLVGEKTRDLQEKNYVLEKNNIIKTRLISIISHDIITPLKFLGVAARGLKENRNSLSEQIQQETIGEITETAQELQLLSTNILNWIKYQNENRRLLPETFRPHQTTAEVFSVLGSLAKQKKLILVNRVDPNLSLIQFVEPMKILIYNLVSNSIRYSDKGSIVVDLMQREDGLYQLQVSDQGIGMSDGKIRNILMDDVQVREVSAEKRSGHGLGYLIIKDLVRWMNARLKIKSNAGVGTEVRVVFQSSSLSSSEMV